MLIISIKGILLEYVCSKKKTKEKEKKKNRGIKSVEKYVWKIAIYSIIYHSPKNIHLTTGRIIKTHLKYTLVDHKASDQIYQSPSLNFMDELNARNRINYHAHLLWVKLLKRSRKEMKRYSDWLALMRRVSTLGRKRRQQRRYEVTVKRIDLRHLRLYV